MRTGSSLGSFGKAGSGVPGSTLKPFFLEFALEHHIVNATAEVYCRRDLRIGMRSLACSHPRDEVVFRAENALAESCNTYFAELGRRFSGPALDEALRQSGLSHGSFDSANAETRELVVLGLKGVMVSPLELASSYRRLALSLAKDGPVARGLSDSVRYGMADEAAIVGMNILGKTGTASNPGEVWTHGWFAGFLPGQLVLVIMVPHGDGGTAARLAGKFFLALKQENETR